MCAKNNQRRVLSALCLGPLGLLGSLDHLVCGACVQSQISHSAQSGAGPRAAHNQRETSCWLAKQRNDRLVILRT